MRLVLDACVLYPTVLRELLIGVAARGGFVPLWSARILGEWQHAAARLGPEGAAIASGEIAVLRARWPMAELPADPVLEARLSLPDPADTHVLAVAMRGDAEAIVTLNLRDFPRNRLEGLRAFSPDEMLMDLWLQDSALVDAAVAEVQARTEEISARPQPLRPLLKRAQLPRLGKALGG
ncbi:hypothetical protein ROE7235_00513 [Roseibaca ekhonensis]|jgi:predicted nucleic acid-binding protein|uniref:PIN domain-containing protein n=1 Tax=Roseinatronobacter ekhonensis TaxID=254356 RepID=A0A3B0MS41_9RHOB|nr:PIN domain-containing protein [Roseibaca ekhonensis]SUZ30786.1 hypothetical protein ROE7235_00513 [Roseibaca ekhonensis]